MLKHNIFNPVTTDLLKGINLIEASAGTGKTYAIAMLVLRFVVEKNLDIKQILVVTFTKAATEELRNRIRSRLVETRLAAINPDSKTDLNIKLWLNNLAIEQQILLQRLDSALFDIDQASIFTLHGFCQRILVEHALESGQLFDSELTGDISAIKQACSDDFWRKQIYLRSAWEVSLLLDAFQTPDQLLASVDFIAFDLDVFPAYADLDQKLIEIKLLAELNRSSIHSFLEIIETNFSEGKFKKSFSDGFSNYNQTLDDWFSKEKNSVPDFSLLTDAGLLDALNGNKFRKSKKNPLSSDEQKHLYINSLELDTEPFEQLDTAINNIQLIFRRALLQTLRVDVDKRLQQLNSLSFDDLISRLAIALNNDSDQTLHAEIRQKYQAALIDEFQDTDAKQWQIFSSLFNFGQHYLYLIGDPKQAIYKFRGADIYTYFDAQQQADHQFTLDSNWRSHPKLVTGINALFAKENAFSSPQLSFKPVTAALTSDQGVLIQDNQELSPLVICQLDKGESEHWTSGKATTEIITIVVNEILSLLNHNIFIQSRAEPKLKSDDKKQLQANDIAILVRSHAQAKEFQQRLIESGVNAVINSKESVFSSHEAGDLYQLLQAIAQPANINLLKQALTLDWFNLNGQQLHQSLNDEVTMDGWLENFLVHQQIWQKKGLLAMMQHFQKNAQIQLHLSKRKQSERRITNLQHCIELIQQAVIDEHLGINKTLDWLHKNIMHAASNNTPTDEQQLRLESDENAIKILTLHSSKGLEYPIVFCPFLWQRGKRLKTEKLVVKCHTPNGLIADLGSEQFEAHRQLALEEELAEDLRIFYVAVTRAKYRCYINWADVRTKDNANDSAMAYLFDFLDDNFSEQENKLKDFCNNLPSVAEYRLSATELEITEHLQKQQTTQKLTHKKTSRSLFTHWQMSSYTALSSLSMDDAPELPNDKTNENLIDKPIEEEDEKQLPRGAHTGNVIHDLLEIIPFKQLAKNADISLLRNKSCLRYGLKTDAPEQIDQLLQQTVKTCLSKEEKGFSLKNLNEDQCLKEMPFYLAMKTIDMYQINSLLKGCPTFQPLSEKKMCGYLTGFIDLICEYKGKYFVMDYKSNYLPSYDQANLIEAMRQHNYGLQYWIYTVVLHQYLQNRLADYSYQKHIGGVKYLFVRGMDENLQASGVYQTLPDQAIIEQLAELFAPDSHP